MFHYTKISAIYYSPFPIKVNILNLFSNVDTSLMKIKFYIALLLRRLSRGVFKCQGKIINENE